MLTNTKVLEWAEWEGSMYSTHLPSNFIIEGTIEDVRKGFNWCLLGKFRGPCADRYGLHDFFSTEAMCKKVLESSHGFIVHVEENPGHGSWRDAVFEVKTIGNDEWSANLLFYNAGSTNRTENHNKFLLIDLKENKLEIVQMFLSKVNGSSEVTKIIEVFKETSVNPSIRI
jgi:hypothetical protein